MGRFKLESDRTDKRLAKINERKLMEQELSERDETKPRHEKVIRRPAQDPRQKKG